MTDMFSTLILSAVPESLLEQAETTSTSNALSDQHSSIIEVLRSYVRELERLEQKCSEMARNRKKKLADLSAEKKQLEHELQLCQKEKIELKEKIKHNKSLCDKRALKDPDDDKLSDLVKKVACLKEDLETKKENILSVFNGYRRGIQFYNKYLQVNVFVDEKKFVIFTPNLSAKSASEVKEYIRFKTADGINFKYVEMQPILKNEMTLVQRFEEKDDIQGFILTFLKALRLRRKPK